MSISRWIAFGVLALASAVAGAAPTFLVSGSVFNDLNGDGINNGGFDPGVFGWSVSLFDSSNALIDSSVTGAGGGFTFVGIGAGIYHLGLTVQPGWTGTYAMPSLGFTVSGSDVTGLDLGVFQLVSVSGVVYNDLNGNGMQGAGEPGLAGIEVQTIDSSTLAVVASAISDSSGNYTITGVGPGSFVLREAPAAGCVVTQPSSPNYYSFTSSSGVNVVGGIFGSNACAASRDLPEPASLSLLMVAGVCGVTVSRRPRAGAARAKNHCGRAEAVV